LEAPGFFDKLALGFGTGSKVIDPEAEARSPAERILTLVSAPQQGTQT